jgi:hypothetical protein
MTAFKVGTSVDTGNVPNVTVDIDQNAPLASGKYTFQLVVTDNDHAVSDPARVTVIVLDNTKPTAVIDGPASISVAFGRGFTLTATGSHANTPAIIANYNWTLLSAG